MKKIERNSCEIHSDEKKINNIVNAISRVKKHGISHQDIQYNMSIIKINTLIQKSDYVLIDNLMKYIPNDDTYFNEDGYLIVNIKREKKFSYLKKSLFSFLLFILFSSIFFIENETLIQIFITLNLYYGQWKLS